MLPSLSLPASQPPAPCDLQAALFILPESSHPHPSTTANCACVCRR
jgi:hypothetical protein